MSLTDELQKLTDLYDDGVLTEAEFTEAKRQLLHPAQSNLQKPVQDTSVGPAVNKYIDFQIASGIIGFVLAIIWIAFLMSRATH